LYRKLKKIKTIKYQSTDLSGDFIADYAFDITNLEIEDNSLDLVICYHILEHIIDDTTAMKELYRVMKLGAKALVQTPFKEGTTYEDFSIQSDEERLKHFGQEDHVRIYSISGLKERLENCGFLVEVRGNFNDEKKYGLNPNEKVIVLTKPLHS
jgi:ubiquinone/menaquinone biosynthesis C-methylase UbiE